MESNILLVDDVRLFLEIQRDFLKHSSVRVTTAQNGAEALHIVKSEYPALVFMDYEMPEMSGADCCRAIKSDPATAGIPVVMITAKGDPKSEQCCRLAGCDGFLTKPLDRNVFLEAAGRFVGNIERREVRTQVELPGVVYSRGTALPCVVESLSCNGAFIVTDIPVEVGRAIEIGINLPDGSEIRCRGSIIWSRGAGAGRGSGLGVGFILPSASTKSALSNFLKNE